MAGNTRGKLKEQLEGIHSNCDWIIKHVDSALALIKEHKPQLSGAVKSLGKIAKQLDEFTQEIYSKI